MKHLNKTLSFSKTLLAAFTFLTVISLAPSIYVPQKTNQSSLSTKANFEIKKNYFRIVAQSHAAILDYRVIESRPIKYRIEAGEGHDYFVSPKFKVLRTSNHAHSNFSLTPDFLQASNTVNIQSAWLLQDFKFIQIKTGNASITSGAPNQMMPQTA